MSKCWVLDDEITSQYDELREPHWCHADTRNEARTILANSYDVPYLWTRVYRFPAGDDTGITPVVALALGLYHWHECFGRGCYERVYGDGEEMDGLYSLRDGTARRAAVDDRGRVYCSPECAAKVTTA